MIKNIAYLAFLIFISFNISCGPSAEEEAHKEKGKQDSIIASKYPPHTLPENRRFYDALTLCLDKNVKYKNFPINTCKPEVQYFGCISPTYQVGCELYLLPLSKDVIDAAVNLKCAIEKINVNDKNILLIINYKRFLNLEKTPFILLIITNELTYGTSISFSNFDMDVSLKTEKGMEYKPFEFTHSLGAQLSTGINEGFVYFDGVVPKTDNSYSVHFNNFIISCLGNRQLQSWAFTFDQTEINFLTLIDKGLSPENIRLTYIPSINQTNNFTYSDIINVAGMLLKVISKL